MSSFDDGSTEASVHPQRPGIDVQRFRLVGVEGATAPFTWQSTREACSIGSHPSNEVVLEDSTVSRFHCEVRVDARGATVKDLGSKNGTSVDGVSVLEAFVREGSVIRVGGSAVRFELDRAQNRIEASSEERFGTLLGKSVAMRTTFAQLERASKSDITVLLEGETGTGKEGAAAAIHSASARRDRPLVVIDCSALPANLLESELFGHERGAFTGAEARRVGAFEEANGGTVLLDEIGELPVDLQPKLLRVLEQREVRRLGSNTPFPVDVRLIAATNRDLRTEINEGRFRSDLYFRLAVLRIHLPALRSRPEDLPLLAEHLLKELGKSDELPAICTPAFFATLNGSAWPGNVRELRNHLERCLLFQEAVPFNPPVQRGPREPLEVNPAVPFTVAKQSFIEDFERQYIAALLKQYPARVAQAAEAAGVDRAYLYRLMRKYQLKSQ
ncbi:MAG: Sigma-54 dependent transcriptional regulator, Fis family [Myxococcaceae bacterium]|nr:Sigma-54 dependent transcriptional regulator, Fis family [Myxococcaceae bacterium]